ncbi:MAG: hypothetical protein WCO23_02320 [bacterium]
MNELNGSQTNEQVFVALTNKSEANSVPETGTDSSDYSEIPGQYRERVKAIDQLLNFQSTGNSIADIRRFAEIINYDPIDTRILMPDAVTPENMTSVMNNLRSIRAANLKGAEIRKLDGINISTLQDKVKSDILIENAVINKLISEFNPITGEPITDATLILHILKDDIEKRFPSASNASEDLYVPSEQENLATLYRQISTVLKELQSLKKN